MVSSSVRPVTAILSSLIVRMTNYFSIKQILVGNVIEVGKKPMMTPNIEFNTVVGCPVPECGLTRHPKYFKQ